MSNSNDYDKQIRLIQELILEDWPDCDIISQIEKNWSFNTQLAEDLLNKAKLKWLNQPEILASDKQKIRIESLKRLKRTLKSEFKGTPEGIKAILQIEQFILSLEQPNVKRIKKTVRSGAF